MSAEWTDKGPAPQSDDFKRAVEEVKKLKQSPTNEQLLTVSNAHFIGEIWGER
jgi:hypothetical protein